MRHSIVAMVAIMAIVASIVARASPAGATTATSPPILVAGTQSLYCLYSNLETKKEVVGSRFVVDGAGARNYVTAVTIPPGSTGGWAHPSAFGVVRCGLDGKFRRRRVMVTACVLSGDVTQACVSTSP